MAIRISLNSKNPNAFAFFDQASRLHLTLEHPVGITDGMTPAIQRGIDSKKLVVLEEQEVKKPVNKTESEEPKKQKTQKPQEQEPEENGESKLPDDAQKEQAPPKRRGRKAKS